MTVANRQSDSALGRSWLDNGWCIAFIAALSALPLFWPSIPPLVDLPGHIGRYAIQIDLAGSAARDWYSFDWSLIGNLGVDLLVELVAPLLGLELAVKLIVMAIPALQVAGFLLVARELWGRIPPTTLFALPLAYGYPFQFGFINFSLSVALCFLCFAMWLRMRRLEKLRQRMIMFIPITLLLWLTHQYGYAIFCILAFCAEVEADVKKHGWHCKALISVVQHCAMLLFPLIPMVAVRGSGLGIGAWDWFNWDAKLNFIAMTLRDHWQNFDLGSLVLLCLIFAIGMFSRRTTKSPALLGACTILALLFVIMPRILFGSAYADMRLGPFIFATALLALGPTTASWKGIAAAIAVAFCIMRLGGHMYSFATYDRAIQRSLQALPHIPKEARLFSLVGQQCRDGWQQPRLGHMPSIALVRRHSFANDQWALEGSQLLKVRYLEGSKWTKDPSQFVAAVRCSHGRPALSESIRDFPRASFDYLWIISKPEGAVVDEAGLIPLWRSGSDSLYRIDHIYQQSR